MGRDAFTIDWVGLAILVCLGVFGISIILTINQSLATGQILFLLVGIILAVVFSFVHPAMLRWFAPFGYVASLLFLLSAYFGPSIRGASRWIIFGSVQLQPSEFVKPMLLLSFSWMIATYPPRQVKNLPMHILFFLIPFFLVIRQPDLGSGLVYGAFWIAMMLAGGLRVSLFVTTAAIGMTLVPWLWQLLASYQKARILTFINPALDPKGASYNAIQAIIAVGSGQLFGRGLGRGTQSLLRFLPEHHTDFIFATLVEELGFLGGILLLAGYAVLLWRIIVPLITGKIDDVFLFVFTVGLFAMILAQVFINVGMNMGIVPITGITLPLVSYGGSSVLSIGLSFGFLWSLQRVSSVAGRRIA